jgi:glycosyltransferase involved in cell wall biosynthesis
VPKISIVIPTYQRGSVVAATVRDLLARQTLQDFEVIVADDGSTDDTAARMAELAGPRVKYLRREHLGMPGILNEGLAAASGEFIMTCHDHDVYAPTLLSEMVAALERHPTALFAFCGIVLTDASGSRVLANYVADYSEFIPGTQFLQEVLLPGLDCKVSALSMVRASALISRRLLPEFEEVADVDLWLHLSSMGDVVYVRSPLIRVKERDRTSELHAIGCRLLSNVIRAKRQRLARIADPRQRSQVEAGWRRSADVSALRELLVAIEDGRRQQASSIQTFCRREGSRAGAALVTLFAGAPLALSRPVLITARRLSRYVRRAPIA